MKSADLKNYWPAQNGHEKLGLELTKKKKITKRHKIHQLTDFYKTDM